MQFEVNEQSYFLNFIPEKGRWFLFKPTDAGIEAVAVVDDDGRLPPLIDEDVLEVDADPEVVN